MFLTQIISSATAAKSILVLGALSIYTVSIVHSIAWQLSFAWSLI